MFLNRHVTDRDLVLVLDDELPRRRAARIAAHLAQCGACRARKERAAGILADVGRAYRQDLSSSGSGEQDLRGRLQRQLARATPVSPRSEMSRTGRLMLTGSALAYASVAFLVAAFGVQALRSRDWRPAPHAVADQAEPGALPVAELTPGATRPVTLDELCGGQTIQPRTIPPAVQQAVLRDYHMGDVPPHEYELDYLITPELGGSADRRNLWPERYTSRVWNARVKDELENLLPRLVCEGQVGLATAQRDIATDWIAAYKKYFQTDRPLKSSHFPGAGTDGDRGAQAVWARQIEPNARRPIDGTARPLSPDLDWRR